MKIVLVFLVFLITNVAAAQKEFVLYFDSNKDIPTEKSLTEFNDFVDSSSVDEILSISGYCDSEDTKEYNKELAARRINSVLKLLKEKKFALDKKVEINAVGEDFEHSENKANNRKVVISHSARESSLLSKENDVEFKKDSLIVTKEKIENERISLVEKFEKSKVGDRIPIYNIHFKFNSENIVSDSESLLEELLFIMERNTKMSIKIHGHICCNPNPYNTKLSYRRALKIFNFLKSNGIPQNRLAYNGVGSNNPIYAIPERNEEERIINRRVEIEIIRK